MSTAQDRFDLAVREQLRPRLEALGLRGSGTTFTVPSKTHFATIGLQKSQFSDRDALKFTANVTVVARGAWEASREERPYRPKRPAPNTFYGSDVWQRRIGKLLPEGADKWWWVSDDADAVAAVDDLAAAIETYVLPAMHAQLNA